MITFDHVSKTYPNGVKGLVDINLTIPDGEYVSIIGLSGAGKSTLLRAINRLNDVTEGVVSIDGQSITGANKRELKRIRRKIGLISQQFNLVKRLTVQKNVLSGKLGYYSTFNAMRLFHQHQPAIMGAALESDCWCEAICDGRHLHPGTVRMLLKCKGWDRVIAITDSIMAAGLPDGNYKLGVNDVVVRDGDAVLASNGVRAGSTLTLAQALRNIVAFTDRPVQDVIPLMTANPAKALRMDDRKGSIEVGKDADMVLLDDELNVVTTVGLGRVIYTA